MRGAAVETPVSPSPGDADPGVAIRAHPNLGEVRNDGFQVAQIYEVTVEEIERSQRPDVASGVVTLNNHREIV
jgi:hypothetical protein